MVNLLTQAIDTAVRAHYGQLDKAGKPYILHPLRVGAAGTTEGEQIVGFLHDVVEDTNVTLEDIRRVFGKVVAEAVDAVTKRKGETYHNFIQRSMDNAIGKQVKINDIKDNLRRMEGLSLSEQEGMTRRYRKALTTLGVEEYNV
jgi:(p)ppGpp synthase/HD superfamily hydrolase